MTIHPFFSRETDGAFLSAHFEVKDTNVGHLEDADIVLVGNNHCISAYQKKFIWLVNTRAKPARDLVLLEGRNDYSAAQDSFLPKIPLRSWDSALELNRMIQKIQECEKVVKALENCPADRATPTEILHTVATVSACLNPAALHLQLDKMLKWLDKKDLKSLASQFELRPQADFIGSLSQEIQKANAHTIGSLYREFSLKALKYTLQTFNVMGCLTMAKRNWSLVKNIHTAKPTQKVFVMAGASHLFKQDSSEPTEIIGEGVLKKGLSSKKYVVLMPTEREEGLDKIDAAISSIEWSHELRSLKNTAVGLLVTSIAIPLLLTQQLPSPAEGIILALVQCLCVVIPYKWVSILSGQKNEYPMERFYNLFVRINQLLLSFQGENKKGQV